MKSKAGWMRKLALAAGLAGGLSAAGTAAAQQPAPLAPPSQRTIRVSGTGEARARPDAARLTFAVETFSPTAREAGAENAEVMERVVQALLAAGVARSDIESSNYSVFPEYVPPERDQPQVERIRGYRATNQVSLLTTELERLGDLIDVALAAGANRVDGINFELRQAEAVQAQALRNAVDRARASAETIAAALGVRLGELLDASTGVEPIRPVPFPYAPPAAPMMARDAAAKTPIQPGEQTVNASVTLVFSIR